MRFSILAASLAALGAPRAFAQCPQWTPGFGGGGADAVLRAFLEHDDGSGAALYAGGAFTLIGDVSTKCVARWDGQRWSAVGLGAGFDDGVWCLGEFQGDLLAGGDFHQIDGIGTPAIARWDGSSWSTLGGGLAGTVHAIAEYAGDLYIAGSFVIAGTTEKIARWNGASWTSIGTNLGGIGGVDALCVADLGQGARLFAGGLIQHRVQAWNGSTWTPMPTGNNAHVWTLEAYDAGSGP